MRCGSGPLKQLGVETPWGVAGLGDVVEPPLEEDPVLP
jgi:hypothetical protein